MQYRIAIVNDLKQIAQVHIACFPHTMWDFLGQELVQNFYEEYLRENPLFVVATDNETIIGFCMGYKVPTQARTLFMQKNRMKLIKRIMIGLLTFNKLVIDRCLKAIKPHRSANPIKAEGDLLSICVLDEYKGRGVAQQLIKRFEEELLSMNIHDYTLSVYTSNSRAIAFYQRQGLRVEDDSDETQVVMYKSL